MHPSLLLDALIFVIVLAVWAVGLFWPGLYMVAVKAIMRSQPEARAKFIGRGGWVRFSRRFGRLYSLGALALAMIWVFIGATFLPNTEIGGMLALFPAMGLGVVSAGLGSLVICRWLVDED